MNEALNIADQTLVLHRHPRRRNETLQAWDSADEYLINHFNENEFSKYITDDSRLLIINDGFGALSCYFNEIERTVISDSFLSISSIKLNLQRNRCVLNAL